MTPRLFVAIGSSHLFGLIDRYIEPVSSAKYRSVWSTGVPFREPIELDAPPGWRGEHVLYNTPVAGPPPMLKEGVLYIPDVLTGVLGHIPQEAEVIFSLLRGQEFAIAALVDDPSHGDFLGDDGRMEPGRRWMSRTDALAWVRQIAEPLWTTHLALRQQFPRARIVHVPAPPPVESHEHIAANPEAFGQLFAVHGIKPFTMRQRIYRLMYGDLNQRLAQMGILSLAPPVGALTGNGGLKAEFARGCLHGNELYAELLAQQIREVLADVPPL
ncbi:hypothetical protein [Roseateles sp. P5_E4]